MGSMWEGRRGGLGESGRMERGGTREIIGGVGWNRREGDKSGWENTAHE